MRIKIDYGIDLGTTNSAIVRMEKGKPQIIKSDTQKDTVPSCVHFNKHREVMVGDTAMNVLMNDATRSMKTFKKGETNTYIEFKRTMGTTHTYRSKHLDKDLSSEELSYEVLKKLKSLVLDENISSIVVTVPAKFLSPQNDATIKAAKLAGFEQVALLQEPIAAAMAYGLDAGKKNGYWMVFDFGGGTFDVALVKAEEGILSVRDTEGDNRLGGKNLDEAIVDKIILPYLQKTYSIEHIFRDPDKKEILRNGVKRYAEEAKIQMSYKDAHNIVSQLGDLPFEDEFGEEPEIDVAVTQKDMEYVLSPIFQRAIDITKEVLTRNNLRGADLDALILVGGPTHSPILRRMLREQITENVDASKDPMTVVAQGAALYASTIDIEQSLTPPTPFGTLRLEVKYEAETVATKELVRVRVSNVSVTDEIFVDIKRSDEGWSSGMKRINDKKAAIIEALLEENCSNSFEIHVFDSDANRLDSEPDQFTIIQGIGGRGVQVLPYHIGIAKYFDDKDADLFFPIKGLEKNKPLPATGVINGLKIRQAIRAGNAKDGVRIPIYQGDYNAAGTDPSLNHFVYEVVLTGDDIPGSLPEGSNFDITVKIDKSQTMHFKAYFPSLDYTTGEMPIEIKQTSTPSASDLAKQIDEAKTRAKNAGKVEIVRKYSDLEERLENEKGSADGLMNIQDSLNKIKRGDDSLVADKWAEVEKDMLSANAELNKMASEKADLSPGDKAQVDEYNWKMKKIIAAKDVKEAKKLTQDMHKLIVDAMDEKTKVILLFMYLVQSGNPAAYPEKWKDPEMAAVLINGGLKLLNENKLVELIPVIQSLLELWTGEVLMNDPLTAQ
jgi:molecular chaperone DnaK